MDGRMGGWTDRWKDGWKEGRKEGWMDELAKVTFYVIAN
jgi:hypothetical protein